MKTTNWQKMKKKTQTVSDEHFIDIHVVLKRKQKLYFNLSTGYSHVTQSVLSPWTLLLLLKVHRGPASGGGDPILPVWILKRLVSVFINACRLLSALPSLLQFGQGRLSLVAISFYALLLLFGPCRLLEFTMGGPLHSAT